MALLSWDKKPIKDKKLLESYFKAKKLFKTDEDIFLKILPLEEFEATYLKETGRKSPSFLVGYALSNGRIVVLDKNDFPKKRHSPEEFKKVLCHEICHIFFRRAIWPKTTYRWIEEGFCEYLSFGKIQEPLNKIVPFSQLEKPPDWRKNPAYSQSRAFFEYLDKKFGKEKIVKWIKQIKYSDEAAAFEKTFSVSLKNAQDDFLEQHRD